MDLRPLSHPLTALLIAAVIPVAACKKKEEPAPQGNQPGMPGIQINTGPGTGVMAAPESDVTRYSDEGPEIGTTTVRRVAVARKAADQGAEIITRIGPGTAINKKARKGPYYLVEYPAAPNQMRLAWILQDDVNGAPTAAVTPTVTVAPPATSTAAPPGGRPPLIRIPKK